MSMDAEKETVASFGGREAGYLVEFKSQGVFLTVYPEGTDISVDLTDIQAVLQNNGAAGCETETLARTIQEKTGEPVKIADNYEAADPKIKIEISQDKMTAKVFFEINENSKKPTKQMVLEAIEERGILFGIDYDKIEPAAEGRLDGTVVAQGQAPQHGQDAQIKAYFDLADKGRPAHTGTDKVDYKDLNLFVLVAAGDVLAERIPHTAGIAGTNIFGETVEPRGGKPKPLPNGKNTQAVGDTVVAALAGQVMQNGKKISVNPVLSIAGDVDLSTGNINFNGSVQIRGSVQDGFSVCADGDVEIKGNVSGGNVAARNIIIAGGVQGMHHGKLTAREDIRASFAENANLTAEHDVYINDVVLHSEVQAGRRVIVDGRRGQVTGGNIVAGEEIHAKLIGNSANILTTLEVGTNPGLLAQYTQLRKKLAQDKAKLDQIHKTLHTLQYMDKSKFSPERIEQFAQLTRLQFPLAGQVERDEKKLQEMQGTLETIKKGKIKVADKAYPGVKLTIGSIIKTLQTESQHCTFYVDEQEMIRTGAY